MSLLRRSRVCSGKDKLPVWGGQVSGWPLFPGVPPRDLVEMHWSWCVTPVPHLPCIKSATQISTGLNWTLQPAFATDLHTALLIHVSHFGSPMVLGNLDVSAQVGWGHPETCQRPQTPSLPGPRPSHWYFITVPPHLVIHTMLPMGEGSPPKSE